MPIDLGSIQNFFRSKEKSNLGILHGRYKTLLFFFKFFSSEFKMNIALAFDSSIHFFAFSSSNLQKAISFFFASFIGETPLNLSTLQSPNGLIPLFLAKD